MTAASRSAWRALMILDDPENWKHWRRTVEKRVALPPVEVDETTDSVSAHQ